MIAVGYDERDLRPWFSVVSRVGTIDNAAALDNDEQGQAVWVCHGPRQTWRELWPEMRRLG